MAEVSVGGGVGGGLYNTSLTPAEASLATSLLSSFSTSEVKYESGVLGSYRLGSVDKVLILGPGHATANDTISAQTSNAVLVGNQGNDTFYLSGNGTVVGGDGNNTVVVAGAGTSAVYLGNGNDSVSFQRAGTIQLGSGNDTVNLGSGNDTVTVAGMATVSSGFMFAQMDGGTVSEAKFGSSELVTASGSVSVHGGAGEWLKGSDGATLKAVAGGDTLQGYQGNVKLVAVTGTNDFLFNKPGSGVFQDTVVGVAGRDNNEH